MPDPRAIQFDHLSFNLPDEEALLSLRDRLKQAGCEVTDVVDHGFIRSVYFTDPNGIALEASWWTLDATGRPADYGDDRLFGDPDPVPAVDELRTQRRADQRPADPARLTPGGGVLTSESRILTTHAGSLPRPGGAGRAARPAQPRRGRRRRRAARRRRGGDCRRRSPASSRPASTSATTASRRGRASSPTCSTA